MEAINRIEMYRISIIVPIYNSEKYLEECIISVLNQTFTDIELILIDDGSVDKSGMICDDYAKKDSRIVVVHTSNKGVSAARNKGIEIARGRYVMFCDADDMVNEHWCKYLYDTAIENEDCLIVSDDTFQCVKQKKMGVRLVEECSFYSLYVNGLSSSVWNKIFRRDVILNNDICFDVSLPYGEDIVFVAKYMKYCTKGVKRIRNVLYHYRKHDDSALKKYNPCIAMYLCKAYYMRALVVEQEYLSIYCDRWLNGLLHTMENVFDERNVVWTFVQKIRFNQSVISSKECQFCVSHSNKKESPLIIFLLKREWYLFMYGLKKIIEYKDKYKFWGQKFVPCCKNVFGKIDVS